MQKRPAANGRSPEITSTTVFGSAPAVSLNLRADVAQMPVSRLATMSSTLRLPAKSLSETSPRSLPTSVNAGAVWPTVGNVPAMSIGLPLCVTLAIAADLLLESPCFGSEAPSISEASGPTARPASGSRARRAG